MKNLLPLLFCVIIFSACQQSNQQTSNNKLPVEGTWKLLSGTLIEKGDTTITDYTTGRSFIKIINGSHFAFLQHDLNNGKDSTASYSSGGGTYTLTGNNYTEKLEYCSDRAWENNSFDFEISISNDTLVQSGVEKIASQGIERQNIERYTRVINK